MVLYTVDDFKMVLDDFKMVLDDFKMVIDGLQWFYIPVR